MKRTRVMLRVWSLGGRCWLDVDGGSDVPRGSARLEKQKKLAGLPAFRARQFPD